MTPAAPTVPAVVVAPSVRWRRARFGLLVVLVALIGCGVFVADRPSTVGDLKAGLMAGRVDEVRVSGELPPGANGYATVTLAWDEGALHRYAEVVQVSDASVPPHGGDPSVERVVGGVDDVLRPLDAAVSIVRVVSAAPASEVAGWRVPGWFPPVLFLLWGCTLVLVAYGPEPWWATRGAWTWAFLSPAATVVVPLFLLVSGPPPGVTSAGGTGRRLRGGVAFVLVWLLGPVLAHLLLAG